MITVAVCAHNLLAGGRRRYLRAALKSIERQTLSPGEVLVVDDGSTDGTADWIAKQRFANVRLVRSRRNLGSARQRNTVLRAARGELIGFLDSDDEFQPLYLEKMSAAFADARVMTAVSGSVNVDAKGAVIPRAAVPRREDEAPRWYSKATGLRYLPGFSSILFRRRVFSKTGFLDEGLRYTFDDADILYRIGLRCGKDALRLVDEPLTAYRKRGRSQLTGFLWSLLDRGRSSETCCAGVGRVDREIALDLCHFAFKHGLFPARAAGAARAAAP